VWAECSDSILLSGRGKEESLRAMLQAFEDKGKSHEAKMLNIF
jgi:hypothetical protein